MERETVVLGQKRKNELVRITKEHLFPDVYITSGHGVYTATCNEETMITDDVHAACARFLLAIDGEWE